MKLFYSPASPFVRKVRLAAGLRGIADRIELAATDTMASPPDLLAANPLSKIPALVTDNGQSLFDSPVICEYLDSLGEAPRLFPEASEARWGALRLQALGDGIMDAAVMAVYEGRRPQEEARSANIARQKAAIARGLDALEAEVQGLEGDWTIGSVTVVCALGYLNFRLGGDNWLATRPKLAAWYERVSTEPLIAESAPA